MHQSAPASSDRPVSLQAKIYFRCVNKSVPVVVRPLLIVPFSNLKERSRLLTRLRALTHHYGLIGSRPYLLARRRDAVALPGIRQPPYEPPSPTAVLPYIR